MKKRIILSLLSAALITGTTAATASIIASAAATTTEATTEAATTASTLTPSEQANKTKADEKVAVAVVAAEDSSTQLAACKEYLAKTADFVTEIKGVKAEYDNAMKILAVDKGNAVAEATIKVAKISAADIYAKAVSITDGDDKTSEAIATSAKAALSRITADEAAAIAARDAAETFYTLAGPATQLIGDAKAAVTKIGTNKISAILAHGDATVNVADIKALNDVIQGTEATTTTAATTDAPETDESGNTVTTASEETDASGNVITTTDTLATTANNNNGGANPSTGVAFAAIPALIAGGAIIIARKRK